MDKVIGVGMSLVVVLVMSMGLKAIADLNDGRVSVVVSQMVGGR